MFLKIDALIRWCFAVTTFRAAILFNTLKPLPLYVWKKTIQMV